MNRLTKTARPGGSDTWSLAMFGITLVLAVCGGIVAAGRRFLPQRAKGEVQVISRVSLSPKHAVYVLRVGRRVLLVGAGPQGAPSLISELEDYLEVEPDLLPQGEEA
jgi:flagellar biogenesis protein FliO